MYGQPRRPARRLLFSNGISEPSHGPLIEKRGHNAESRSEGFAETVSFSHS